MHISKGKWFYKGSINIQQERRHGKGQRGNWALFLSMSFREQTLTPAGSGAPTRSRSRSSGVTSTSSLFSSFLFGCFTPPLLLPEFVTLCCGRSFLGDVAGAALIRRVPTISCPSCRLTACSLLRTGRSCSQARDRVALCLVSAVLKGHVEDRASSLSSVLLQQEDKSGFKRKTA